VSSGAALAIVDEPGRGRVFERTIMPGIADAGDGGRVCVDALARWLQDVAYLDLVDAGLEADGAWIMRRGRLVVESFPRFGDEVELRTFCSGIGRFSAERRTGIIGGEGSRVETVSRWICLDPEGRRPQRFDQDFQRAFAETAAGRDANVRVRHPDPPADAPREPWTFRATDLDIAGHVNNSHYWAPIEQDLLDGDEPESFDGEVEHREPASPGEAVILRGEGISWVTSHAGEIHASLFAAI
jgi:acyl-ACP thioesterase